MSHYYCSCGFSTKDADEYGDHLGLAFTPDNDIGTDGRMHAELASEFVRFNGRVPDDCPLPRYVCACSFATNDVSELDDHLLLVFTKPNGVGIDGLRHVKRPDLVPVTPDPVTRRS